jgi:hypothetical protein
MPVPLLHMAAQSPFEDGHRGVHWRSRLRDSPSADRSLSWLYCPLILAYCINSVACKLDYNRIPKETLLPIARI